MSNYKIELQTELGTKSGTMQLFIDGRKANGILTVLHHSEPFSGNINPDGSCTFRGKIVSLLNEICYVASGKLSGNELSLTVDLGKSSYPLYGVISDTK